MNILFLLGNGFDKNLGFPTSYAEFYDYYLSDRIKPELLNDDVKKLRNDIGENRGGLVRFRVADGQVFIESK